MSDYLEPVVATVVGDISDLLAKIAEAQGAMGEFAGSAPAIQFDPAALAGVESAAADTAEQMAQAETAAAMSAEELAAAIGAPLAMTDEELAATIAETEALTASTQELVVAFEEESAAAEQAAAGLLAEGGAADEAGKKAEDAGAKASAANMNWMALGLGFAALTAGPLALSAAVVGTGYLIADFGGTAKGDLQQIEDAFRGTAEAASQSFEPALQNITQSMSATVRSLEPDMAQVFKDLVGPAESFFTGLEGSIQQGMDAVVPAIEQLEPVIATVTSDLGPLFVGVAGFVQQMAAAFEAGGGDQGLAHFAQQIGSLLPVLGQLVGELGSGLLTDLQLLEPPLHAVADVLDGLGPRWDALLVGGLLVAKNWSTLQAIAGGVRSAVEFLGSDFEVLSVEEAGAGAAALEAGASFEEAAAEAETAGEAFLFVEGSMMELLPAAGLVVLAAVELVDHWQGVSSFFEQLGDDAYGWGEAIGDGIGRGIEDAWNFIVKPIEDSINGIKNMFTSGFGIMSPSAVTRGYGVNLGEGVGLGVLDSLPGVQGQIGTFTAGTLGAFAGGGSFAGGGAGFGAGPAPAAGGGASGTTVIYLQPTINVTAPLASAQEIADAVIPALQSANLLNGISMASHSGLKGGPGR